MNETNLSPKLRNEINSMGQVTMARLYRFSPAGCPFFTGDAGQYFALRFEHLGGMTPAISKQIGW